MKTLRNFLTLTLAALFSLNAVAQEAKHLKTNTEKSKLRVLIIGAHPDDAEKSGGTAAKYIQLGHTVQLVSVTNGNKGHQSMNDSALAARRKEEARKSGLVIGAEYLVMDINDGELVPSLENRFKLIKVIREFRPDIIFTHRPNDYHPDHRYTSILVQDAAFMIMVPKVVPDVPALEKNPVIFYMSDNFQKPTPFQADVVVDIDDVAKLKVEMYHNHTSQFYEWIPWIMRSQEQIPEGEEERKEWILNARGKSWIKVADTYREKLIELYGKEKGSKIKYAEAFEACEYGGYFNPDKLNYYFPFYE